MGEAKLGARAAPVQGETHSQALGALAVTYWNQFLKAPGASAAPRMHHARRERPPGNAQRRWQDAAPLFPALRQEGS